MAVRKFRRIDFRAYSPFGQLSTGAAATGADTTVTQVQAGPYQMQFYNSGANTGAGRIIPASIEDANCTNGWELPSTNTDNVGAQMTFHAGAALDDPNNRAVFKVGTDPAFYMKAYIGIPDISDYDIFFCGFVAPAAYVATASMTTAAHLVAAYDDKAGIAIADNTGALHSYTSKAGADVDTDFTLTTHWADDAVKTLEVRVSATGVATYYINGSAPAETVSFTFTDATLLTPWLIFVKCANANDTPPIINYIEWGYQ